MKYENLRQRLVRLYLEAYEIMLKKMKLKETYYFMFYTMNKDFQESIYAYVDTLISRNDYLFLHSLDLEIRMYFTVLANESIHEYLEFLSDDAFTYDVDAIVGAYEQDIILSDQ